MSLLDTINNFYEKLVAEAVEETRQPDDSEGMLADIMCVALNQLPSRYYRHRIDMMFYLSEEELREMDEKVAKAVSDARAFVTSHHRE